MRIRKEEWQVIVVGLRSSKTWFEIQSRSDGSYCIVCRWSNETMALSTSSINTSLYFQYYCSILWQLAILFNGPQKPEVVVGARKYEKLILTVDAPHKILNPRSSDLELTTVAIELFLFY